MQEINDTSKPYFSVVIPVFNEEENLPVLFDEVCRAAARTEQSWELFFVDDASTDDSLRVMRDLSAAQENVHYLAFAKNCGQSGAFSAGFAAANGEFVVTMDADLQNDPADIPAMLALIRESAADAAPLDMVIGWRAKRKDTLAKRLASKFGNAVRNKLSHETVHDTGCSLKIMRASMAKRIPMFTGMHRFLPTLMKFQGAKVAEIKVNHRPRMHGVSKYGIWDRAKATFFDLLAIRWMRTRYINYSIKEQK